ncbi:Piso0_001381 [Millerozyma farinosa CBS 7064]|uniref:Piso0_001381 protein n=1 Tax=Pichia sorbitophila (strain ATCC MYA-4447 / BCRC 22081 / CBS 7064 / NBRC 10061 / NRRL Y-12695) TaxID=559304 RepID=G8YN06_PICSO|nr:Piso0_001381 [Millerozyma farinosa CBS 7064]
MSRDKLSLFTFGDPAESKRSSGRDIPNLSPSDVLPGSNPQLTSPATSPLLDNEKSSSSDIFERSVQDGSVYGDSAVPAPPKCNKCCVSRSRGCSHNSSISLSNGYVLKHEDHIPPALDASTTILNDKDANLDDVEMIYSNRRNSSVIGLNMALGRPFTPSRKNSLYSCSSSHAPQSQVLSQPVAPSQQPISPPKLTSSRSSLSFYSYADMINNEELQKRPAFKQSFSQGQISSSPAGQRKKSPISSNSCPSGQKRTFQSSLSRQLSKSSENKPILSEQKFLISPESSDSEEHESYYSSSDRRNSLVSSASNRTKQSGLADTDNDIESFVSSSVGDCIRQSSTLIKGN